MRICISSQTNGDLFKWHDWFAWRPVFVDSELVWLETVKRRLSLKDPVGIRALYKNK